MKAVDLVCKYDTNIIHNAFLTVYLPFDVIILRDLGFERDDRRNPKAICMKSKTHLQYFKLLNQMQNLIKYAYPTDGSKFTLCLFMNDMIEYHSWFVYNINAQQCIYSRTKTDPHTFKIQSKHAEIF